MPMVLDVKNTYRRLDVVDYYATTNELTAAERVLFEKLRPTIAGKAILDIGIGTGRTTPFLASLTEDYTGVDYSPEMVQRAKELHPRANLLECDARDLSRFGPARFGAGMPPSGALAPTRSRAWGRPCAGRMGLHWKRRSS